MSRIIRHLDKNDLIFILTDYFEVDKDNIKLIPFIETEGYGMGEHEVASVRAEVDITDEYIKELI